MDQERLLSVVLSHCVGGVQSTPGMNVSWDLSKNLVTLLAPPCSQQMEVLPVRLQLYAFADAKRIQR